MYPPSTTDPAHVLIVDDEPMMLSLLALLLEGEGYRVTTCRDGARALELGRAQDWDLVVTDLRMPEVDGFDVLKGFQDIRPDTPVIILTGDEKLDHAIRSIQMGAYDFITKRMATQGSFFLMSLERALEKRRLLQDRRKHLVRIENQNRALREGLRAARHIQKTMMRRDFSGIAHGLTVHCRYLPAEQVGGDFFDVLPLDSHRVLFYMAGVGGYGVSAAMVTVFAKQTIAKLVSGYATEGRSGSFGLSDLLWSFNREINAQGFELDGLPLHLGIFLGFLDSDWSRLICANAGFTPAGRIVGADGSIQSLALSGHPIGLINQPVFDEMEVSLDPEQRIVLFSDGLIEPADGENQRPVETEIDDFLRGHARTPAEDLAEELLREGVRIRKGHLQQDDISLMILEKAA